MSLALFEEELKKIFDKHSVTTNSKFYADVWKECQEWHEGVVSVKDMVIEGVERRADQAEKKVEDLVKVVAKEVAKK